MEFMDLNTESTAQETKNNRTVLLLGRDDLLRQAVEHLITESKDWKVTRILDERRVDILIREVGRIKPDVVVISQSDFAHELDLPSKLMQNYPDIKIITIGSESNLVEVYNKQEISIEQAADFLSIIDQCPHKFHIGKRMGNTGKEISNKP